MGRLLIRNQHQEESLMALLGVFMCVGHDTDLVGSNPTAGIYRQAKRTTSRCQ